MNSFLIKHINELKNSFSNPELELRILLKKSSLNNNDIILSNLKIEDIDIVRFEKVFVRRMKREPISKIFNEKNFWKYDFFVDQDVFDPRPETELIIEKILELYPDKDMPLKILDMCTGSGCLAISLSKEYLNAQLTATDISSKALKIAKINANKLDCNDQIQFIQCNLLKTIKTYDVVVSNPPYLSEMEYNNTSSEIRLFEPKIALIALKNGFEFYEKISDILPALLTANSRAFFEIGYSQAQKIINIFDSKNLNCLKIAKDIQNLDRVLILNKS